MARTVIGDENFGTVMGGVGLVATLGGSFGPVIGGVLRDQFDTPAATMALVVAAAWLSVLVLASLRLQRESIPDLLLRGGPLPSSAAAGRLPSSPAAL